MILGLGITLGRTLLAAADTETERLYVSGHGKDDAVPWQFMCTSGAQSGYWTNLAVPSQWEMHGFGTLHYRKDPPEAWNEKGLYRYDFDVPAGWSGRRIFLIFDGVMTDTDAKLNGQSVGPIHQGGFYQFEYEVTRLVRFGETNRLEVTVAKHSANESVNRAERDADYWLFGGIYRPVYLKAVPPRFIRRVAVDARADGEFTMDVFADGIRPNDTGFMVAAQITDMAGRPAGPVFSAPISAVNGEAKVVLHTQIASPRDWSAETPNLYQVQVWLKDGDEVVHHFQQRFGFRTMEVRDGDGLYVNGHRVVLKGVCRHSFWPDSGRCLSEAIQRLDVETIKDANMNAVRMSHYPPDAQFLEMCDEEGLYVLDELAGWHHYYDNTVGPRLVKEMVTHDVDHPCILFWDNGNEGGFNTNLDRLFDQYDPQDRRVLHPWIPFNGVDTIHYPTYDFVKLACQGYPVYFHHNAYFANTNDPARYIFMPTEFLHGLYDGGAGAGLADVWSLMEQSKYLGGGFIWTFLDEGVKRPDTGQMDVAGNQAPDGIVGPYRQREASFYAIKQIWSPIVILETNLPANFDGTLTVENHFSFTDARQCKFTWQLRRFNFPDRVYSPDEMICAEGTAPSPDIAPGGRGLLHLNLPENLWHASEMAGGNFLAVRIDDPSGRELWRYVWPLRQRPVPASHARVIARADHFGAAHRGVIELKGHDLVVHIDGATGRLTEVRRADTGFSLRNGPRLATTNSTLDNIVWQLRDDGWLQCDYRYHAEDTNEYFGVVFDYPEGLVKAKRWLGDGPYRVWKNRRSGVTLGVWEDHYNNTITGWRDWIYPEFKGCFAGVRWLQLDTSEGTITVVPENVPFVQVLTPEFPPANLVGDTFAPLPRCGLGFLNAIPPMGSKFQTAEAVAPSGQRAVAHGEYSGTVSFYFGKIPQTHPSPLTGQLNPKH
jgi:hypothetical protein